MTDHQIAYNRLLEERRANKAREAETYRANTATEAIRSAELAEKERAARASQLETMRHNDVTEAETLRHNEADEFAKLYGFDKSYSANMANVGLGYSQLSETARSHVRNEELTEWATSVLNATRTAQAAVAVGEMELKGYQNELKARELDLSEERMQLEHEAKMKQIEVDKSKNMINFLSNLLPTAEAIMGFSVDSLYK